MWVTPGHSKSIFCFEEGLIPPSFLQKLLAFRSRLIFFCRLNFSGDRLIQFIDGPLRYWLPADAAFSRRGGSKFFVHRMLHRADRRRSVFLSVPCAAALAP
jgi:hypothetical protein